MCMCSMWELLFQPVQICDVISENGPYCGRNSVFLDQLFLHFCESIFYQNCAGTEKNVSFRCSLATNIVGPDQTPRIMRGIWSGPMICVPQLGPNSQMTSHISCLIIGDSGLLLLVFNFKRMIQNWQLFKVSNDFINIWWNFLAFH